MVKVFLREYHREIEGMIEAGKLTEAIAHCLYILKTFPKDVETYRLLGKTFLEGRHYADAADIFQRVLMVVPDDFVSHVGMSIIQDNNGKLDDAIWHMERAFEIQPSNPAIQGELRRLYGLRDGAEPPRIRLSRDALANMYSNGELFIQAIEEIRAVLAEDPNRSDLQVMLARAYFHGGQKVNAAEIATQLLKKYPNCMDALRILTDVLPDTTRAENTQIYRNLLQLLDPYSAFVTGSSFNSDQVADSAVSLEHLVYKPDEKLSQVQSDWSASLGIKSEDETKQIAQSTWLESTIPVGQSPTAAEVRHAGKVSITEPNENDIPNWMRSAGWKESTSKSNEDQTGVSTSAEGDKPLAQVDIPDWLKSMAPLEVIQGNPNELPESTAEQAGLESNDTSPNWLKGMTPVEVNPAESSKVAGSESDVPDWMKESNTSTQAIGAIEEQAKEQNPLMDASTADKNSIPSTRFDNDMLSFENQDASSAWSENPTDTQNAKEEELIAKHEDRIEDLPNWVRQNQDGKTAETTTSKEGSLSEPLVSGEVGESQPVKDDTLAWLDNLSARKNTGAEDLLTNHERNFSKIPDPLQTQASEIESGSTISEETKNQPTPDIPTPERLSEPILPQGDNPIISTYLNDQEASQTAGELPDWLEELEHPEPASIQIEAAEPTDGEFPEWQQNSTLPADEEPTKLNEDNVPVSSTPTPTAPDEWVLAEKTGAEPEPVSSIVEKQVKTSTPKLTDILTNDSVPDKDEDGLANAQSALNSGQLNEAIREYIKLIKRGHLLEEVIHDLREAIHQFPMDIAVWQTLGDAYMRANRLQDALDTYSKAEELLR